MKQERVSLWDNIKFFLIFMVVVGHFAEAYESNIFKSAFLFIYSFHMPLFLFISGLFYKKGKVRERICIFLSVYMIFKIAIFLVKTAFDQKRNFQIFSESDVPWFVFALAAFYLITYLLSEVDQRYLLIMSILAACFSGYDKSIGDFLCLSRIIVFYPFFLLGTMASRKKLECLLQKKWVRILGWIVLVVWAALCLFQLDPLYIFRHLFTGRNPFKKEILAYGWLMRFLCYIGSGVIGFSFLTIVPSRHLGIVTIFGQRTLQVYFWHRVILYGLIFGGVCDGLCGWFSPWGKIIWLVLALILTFVLSLRIFSVPTATIFKYSK